LKEQAAQIDLFDGSRSERVVEHLIHEDGVVSLWKTGQRSRRDVHAGVDAPEELVSCGQ
jgi:hypothetical protein